MTKRILILDDDDLDRLLSWYDAFVDEELNEQEDDELRQKVADARLK